MLWAMLMNNLPFKNLRSCTLGSATKYTFCLLNMVLKNCLLKCFHALFVALAVKQMNFLLSFQSCVMNCFLNCYHPTTLLSSLHYLPVAPWSEWNTVKWFSRPFLLYWFSPIPPRDSSHRRHWWETYLRETRSRIEWRRWTELL